MVRRQITDSDENGEVIREYGFGYDETVVPFNPANNFIKVFTSELKKVRRRMNSTDILVVMDLLHYISYESGMLSKTGKDDERYPLVHKDIASITGFGDKVIIRTMSRLVNIGIYSRSKYKRSYRYFANPYIFLKGSRINITLKDMFKNWV